MPPIDTDHATHRARRADPPPHQPGHRSRQVVAVLAVAMIVGGVLLALRWHRGPDDGVAAAPTTRSTDSTAASTTAHRRTTTTASTTTTAPPVPTSVPGVNVGPLVGGPGPIPVIHRVPTTDPVVFITIDDGVTADADALNVIRDAKLPVTLFLNQMYLRHNGGYFEELRTAGAVIGSHTTSHANLKGKDPAFQHGQICDLVPEFTSRFGAPPDMFRPPYGNYDAVTVAQAASCGARWVVQWSAVGDSGGIVTAEGPLRAGDIILLHFKPGLGLRLRNIVALIQAAGLRPARLVDYLSSAPPAPAAAPSTSVAVLPETGAAVPPAP